MHEYKRQLLNVLHIVTDYLALKENPELPVLPKTYIFAAKAAAGYYMAKKIIKLICFISEDIRQNPKLLRKAQRRIYGRLQCHDVRNADACFGSFRTDLFGRKRSERHGKYEIHDQRSAHRRDAGRQQT